MNPRKLWAFLRSRFGLFLVFVAVLFVGLWLYGRRQGETRQGARLSGPSKEIEIGQVRVPLEQGLEDGLPQQVAPPDTDASGTSGSDGQLVPFRPVQPRATVVASPATVPELSANREPPDEPRKVHFRTLLASYTPASDPPLAARCPADARRR